MVLVPATRRLTLPQIEKSKLHAFAKKAASPPPAAQLLAKKRAMAKAAPPAAPPPAPAAPGAPPAPAAQAGAPPEDMEMYLHELVEEAAQEAEAGADVDLEDAIGGTKTFSAEQPPEWALDAEKWAEAAQAVGLGGAGDDMYEEPGVVAAYLYKKMGGEVAGMEIPPAPGEGELDEGETDITKPGAAAKAMATAAAAKKGAPGAAAAPPAGPKAPPAPAAAKPPGVPAAPPAAPPAKVVVSPPKPPPAPAGAAPGAPPVAPAAGDGSVIGGDPLKQILDQAAQQATSNPDPAITTALQSEPPAEGQAPSWAADPDKWMKAEEAVKPHWQEYPQPFLVVAHVYKNMGGTVQ